MIDVSELGNTLFLRGCVFGNDDEAMIVMLPNENLPAQSKEITTTVQNWEDILYQTDRMPIEALVLEQGAEKAGKAVVFKSQRQISKNVSWSVFRRDNFSCRYCGCDDKPLTVDHLVLWEDGGPSTENNLVAACSKCNNTRASTPYPEWLSSNYYKKISARLPHPTKFANQALVATLKDIEITPIKAGKKRKRR